MPADCYSIFLQAGCSSWHPTNSVKTLKSAGCSFVRLSTPASSLKNVDITQQLLFIHSLWQGINLNLNCNKSSAVAEMGDRGHNRHGPKRRGGCCTPFAGGQLGPCLTQCCLGQGLLPYQVAFSSIQLFGQNRHGPKIGWGLCPFLLGGAGSPSNTKSPGPRPTSVPSGILIHPAVWPQ